MNAAQQFTDQLRKDPSFKDVTGTVESGYPEIQVVFDRTKLARLGMTPDEAADIMRNAVEGEIPTRFGLAGEELDIRVRANRNTQMTPEDLQHLVINPGASIPILLNSVARRVENCRSQRDSSDQSTTCCINQDGHASFGSAQCNRKDRQTDRSATGCSGSLLYYHRADRRDAGIGDSTC